jgi:hypothetical protein
MQKVTISCWCLLGKTWVIVKYCFKKSIFIGILILLFINEGCNQETKPKNQTLDFLGEWILDNDSYSAIHRGCVSLDFDDSVAKFQITMYKSNYLVRFNNETNTSWQSALYRKSIIASQILNTSTLGRFCGEQTKVRLILRLDPKSRNRIIGKLETSCTPCPDIDFVAYRITNTKSLDK